LGQGRCRAARDGLEACVNQAEKQELDEFEDEMWRARHAPPDRGELAIYAVAFLIYVLFLVYMPLSAALGWWPW
jgi:hypothetical protein